MFTREDSNEIKYVHIYICIYINRKKLHRTFIGIYRLYILNTENTFLFLLLFCSAKAMHIGGGTGQLHSTGNAHTTTIFLSRLPTFRHLPRTTSQAGLRRVIATAAAVTAAAVASVRFVLLTSDTAAARCGGAA